MLKVVIVEDETAASVNLRRMLSQIDPSIEVVALLESVEESVEFFSGDVDADIVFMDIHLADGDIRSDADIVAAVDGGAVNAHGRGGDAGSAQQIDRSQSFHFFHSVSKK